MALSGCVLENSLHCGNDGQNVYSKVRGGDKEILIAFVQFKGQVVVMCSR